MQVRGMTLMRTKNKCRFGTTGVSLTRGSLSGLSRKRGPASFQKRKIWFAMSAQLFQAAVGARVACPSVP
eukprot:4917029-Amphidinium_carterae.1